MTDEELDALDIMADLQRLVDDEGDVLARASLQYITSLRAQLAAANVRADRAEAALVAQPSPDVAALVEALEALIQQTYDCEKELTEVLHHIDFCGESEPLAKARAALARVKGGAA